MKKTLFLTLLGILISCSNEDPYLANGSAKDCDESSCLRTTDEILDIATKAISMLDDNNSGASSRSGSVRVINPENRVIPFGSSVKSRNDLQPLMYVVNFSDDMGFAVVSANKNAPELIAVTEQGHYDVAEDDGNDAFTFYMNSVASVLDSLPSIPSKPFEPSPFQPVVYQKIITDTIWRVNTKKRVNVNWGQHTPEGNYCPNHYCGCSNTAAAMAMSYFRYPESITLKYVSGSPVCTLDWEHLTTHTHTISASICNDIYDSHSQLAHLCRELGYRSDSQYKVDGTGTTISNIKETLEGLGYNVSKHSDPKLGDMALAIGTKSSVLLVRGSDSETDKGHMWVCDGAKFYDIKKRYYETTSMTFYDPDGLEGWTFKEQTLRTYSYNHFNWGWYGSKNGYFIEFDYKVALSDGTQRNYNKSVQYLVVSR